MILTFAEQLEDRLRETVEEHPAWDWEDVVIRTVEKALSKPHDAEALVEQLKRELFPSDFEDQDCEDAILQRQEERSGR